MISTMTDSFLTINDAKGNIKRDSCCSLLHARSSRLCSGIQAFDHHTMWWSSTTSPIIVRILSLQVLKYDGRHDTFAEVREEGNIQESETQIRFILYLLHALSLYDNTIPQHFTQAESRSSTLPSNIASTLRSPLYV